ncbi:MAG: hypothetical protein QGG54_22620, partial [Gammaproteobacteria bacterium]|nr:hypothetical protein [Gammaproteobacteria bacterium]
MGCRGGQRRAWYKAQAGVRLHGGIARRELVCKAFDSSGRVELHFPQASQEFNGTLFHKEVCMV